MVKADDGDHGSLRHHVQAVRLRPDEKYPIIAYVYPGPQTESVTKTFTRAATTCAGAVRLHRHPGRQPRRHPQRSKWYHSYGYGNLRDYGLADKKAAIEQLARRHPFIDINRVGIYGHSGGGFMSAAAMLVYPDFFKVALVGVRQPREQHLQQHLEREASRHQGNREGRQGQLRVRHREELRAGEEPERPPDARARRHRQQRASRQHLSPGRRADQGEQAVRHVHRCPACATLQPVASGYVNWLRGDYFARHLLGTSSESVDIVELNREEQKTGKPR